MPEPRLPEGLSLPQPDDSMFPERPLWRDLGGTVLDLPHVDPDPLWRTLNPGLGLSPTGELLVSLRTSNYYVDPTTYEYYVLGSHSHDQIRSRAFVARLDEDLQLTETPRLVNWTGGPTAVRGVEDCRLLWRGGDWRLLGALFDPDMLAARQVEFALDPDAGDATWTATHEPPSGVEPRRPQKNWMAPALAPSEAFDFVYSATEVLQHGELRRVRDDEPAGPSIRGGSPLWPLADGTYLALVHRVRFMELPPRRSLLTFKTIFPQFRDYRHLLARYDASGRLLDLSPEFSFAGPGLEFGCGLVVRGDDLLLSFGRWDASAHLATVRLDAALDWLKPA